MTETLVALRAFPLRLAEAVHNVSAEQATKLEAEGKWSVADVVAHLADLELVYAVRIRTIVAGAGEAPLTPLAQNAWVERVHRRESVAELLEQFAFLRAMNVKLIERLSADERQRRGIHPEYGSISVEDAAGRLMRHDARHLAQIERIKRTF